MKQQFFPIAFGKAIAAKLDSLGWTCLFAAAKIGVSKSALSRAINGKPVKVETYLRIRKWLETTL